MTAEIVLEHLYLVFLSVLFSTAVGLPLRLSLFSGPQKHPVDQRNFADNPGFGAARHGNADARSG